MARRCVVCEKRVTAGNVVAHSNKKTKRTFAPNLQRIRIVLDGRPVREYVCTRCIKAGKVVRAV